MCNVNPPNQIADRAAAARKFGTEQVFLSFLRHPSATAAHLPSQIPVTREPEESQNCQSSKASTVKNDFWYYAVVGHVSVPERFMCKEPRLCTSIGAVQLFYPIVAI